MSTKDHHDTRIVAENVKERRYTKSLKCPLTDKELLETGDELTEALDHKAAVESELESIRAEYKAKTKAADADIERLRTRHRNKFEMRPIECREVRNYEDRIFYVFRTDTDECIEERPLRQDELQQDLPHTSDADGERETTETVEEDAGTEEE